MLLTDQRGIVRYYEYLDSYGNIGGRVMMVIGVRSLPDPAPVGLTEWKKTKLEVRHYVPEHGSSIHTLARVLWIGKQPSNKWLISKVRKLSEITPADMFDRIKNADMFDRIRNADMFDRIKNADKAELLRVSKDGTGNIFRDAEVMERYKTEYDRLIG